MVIALIVLAVWIGVGLLMALCWSIGAHIGYRRAIEDVQRQVTDSKAAGEISRLDDVEHLVG